MIVIQKYQSFGFKKEAKYIVQVSGSSLRHWKLSYYRVLTVFLSNKQAVGSLMTKLGDQKMLHFRESFPHFPPQGHLSMASFLADFQPLSMHVVRNVACLSPKVYITLETVCGCLSYLDAWSFVKRSRHVIPFTRRLTA